MDKLLIGKEKLDGAVVSVYIDKHGHHSGAFRFMNSRVSFDLPCGWAWPTEKMVRLVKEDFVEFMSTAYCEKCGQKLDISTGRYDVGTDMIVCKNEKVCKERRMNNDNYFRKIR